MGLWDQRPRQEPTPAGKCDKPLVSSRMDLEKSAVGGESPVGERAVASFVFGTRVVRDTWNPVRIWEDHLLRLNTTWRPKVNKYREGKVKSTPARGVK